MEGSCYWSGHCSFYVFCFSSASEKLCFPNILVAEPFPTIVRDHVFVWKNCYLEEHHLFGKFKQETIFCKCYFGGILSVRKEIIWRKHIFWKFVIDQDPSFFVKWLFGGTMLFAKWLLRRNPFFGKWLFGENPFFGKRLLNVTQFIFNMLVGETVFASESDGNPFFKVTIHPNTVLFLKWLVGEILFFGKKALSGPYFLKNGCLEKVIERDHIFLVSL